MLGDSTNTTLAIKTADPVLPLMGRSIPYYGTLHTHPQLWEPMDLIGWSTTDSTGYGWSWTRFAKTILPL